MSPETDLSERELEILRLVATGASNKEIAQKLVISPNTVKVHLRNVFAKVGAASRTEAALFALRTGLVDHVAAAAAVPEDKTPEEEPTLVAAGNGSGLQSGSASLNGDLVGVPVLRPEAESVPLPARRRVLLGMALLAALVLLLAGVLILRQPPPAAAIQATATPGPLPVLASNQRWQSEPDLPEARRGMAAISYESVIYLFGGETPQGVTGSSLSYRPGQTAWVPLAGMPAPLTDIQAARLGEKIYIPGGRQANGQPSASLEIYDLRANHWDQGAALPAARSAFALAAFEGRLYLFGGWDGSQFTDTVYAYDPASDAWQARSPLPGRRGLAAAVGREGGIYVIGGTDGSQPLSRMDTYIPERDLPGQNPWETRAALPQGRSGAAAVLLADLVYVMGGESSGHSGGLAPLQYQPFNDRWTAFDASPVAVGAQPALLALESRLFVIGGATPGAMSAYAQSYQAIYTINLPSIQK